MCPCFRFLSWLKAFLGPSPSLRVCTLPGGQVTFPKSRLHLVRLCLRMLLRTDRLLFGGQNQTQQHPIQGPSQSGPGHLWTLPVFSVPLPHWPAQWDYSWFSEQARLLPPFFPYNFFSDCNALSHFHPLHFLKVHIWFYVLSGALWKSCQSELFISAVIIFYFYFRYCLYHVLCM